MAALLLDYCRLLDVHHSAPPKMMRNVIVQAYVVALSLLLLVAVTSGDPLACHSNTEQSMLPVFYTIGNVTKSSKGSITLEPVNDSCSTAVARTIMGASTTMVLIGTRS